MAARCTFARGFAASASTLPVEILGDSVRYPDLFAPPELSLFAATFAAGTVYVSAGIQLYDPTRQSNQSISWAGSADDDQPLQALYRSRMGLAPRVSSSEEPFTVTLRTRLLDAERFTRSWEPRFSYHMVSLLDGNRISRLGIDIPSIQVLVGTAD
jgi:hypothetical protein